MKKIHSVLLAGLCVVLFVGYFACHWKHNKQNKHERIAKLMEELKDQDHRVREAAARSYSSEYDSEVGKQAVPYLAQALKDDDASVRLSAATALFNIAFRIRTEAKEAVPDLIHTIKQNDSNIRDVALLTLLMIGSEAKEAVPDLIQILEDKNDRMRALSATVLGNIGDARAEGPLSRALKDNDKEIRQAASEALNELKER
jgi:HEAT repeat protein